MTHPTVQRGLMPDYATIDWEDVRFTAHPLGWRGFLRVVPVLGSFLMRAPMFSGTRHVFCVHAKAIKPNRRNDSIEINWFFTGPSQGVGTTHMKIVKPLSKTIRFHAPTAMMMTFGEGSIRLRGASLSTGKKMEGTEEYRDLGGFDVKSSDSLMLLVYGIILTALVGALAAVGGAWAGTRIFQSDEPIRVVVVEESLTPPSAPTDRSQ